MPTEKGLVFRFRLAVFRGPFHGGLRSFTVVDCGLQWLSTSGSLTCLDLP